MIVSARVLTPEGVRMVSKDELSLGYRSSAVMQNGWVVLEATFELAPGSPDEIKATMADLAARRREKQPLQYPSCGSFFKRPVGYYAGALIEQAGLKGYRVGDAQVSEMARGLCHQPRTRHIERNLSPDAGGAAPRAGTVRRNAGAGGSPDRPF